MKRALPNWAEVVGVGAYGKASVLYTLRGEMWISPKPVDDTLADFREWCDRENARKAR